MLVSLEELIKFPLVRFDDGNGIKLRRAHNVSLCSAACSDTKITRRENFGRVNDAMGFVRSGMMDQLGAGPAAGREGLLGTRWVGQLARWSASQAEVDALGDLYRQSSPAIPEGVGSLDFAKGRVKCTKLLADALDR